MYRNRSSWYFLRASLSKSASSPSSRSCFLIFSSSESPSSATSSSVLPSPGISASSSAACFLNSSFGGPISSRCMRSFPNSEGNICTFCILPSPFGMKLDRQANRSTAFTLSQSIFTIAILFVTSPVGTSACSSRKRSISAVSSASTSISSPPSSSESESDSELEKPPPLAGSYLALARGTSSPSETSSQSSSSSSSSSSCRYSLCRAFFLESHYSFLPYLSAYAVAVKSLSIRRGANRLSMVTLDFRLEGKEKRGSVWKFAKRSSVMAAAGLPILCLDFRCDILTASG